MRADDEDCSTSSATGSSCASWSMTLCRRAHSGRWRRVEAVAQAMTTSDRFPVDDVIGGGRRGRLFCHTRRWTGASAAASMLDMSDEGQATHWIPERESTLILAARKCPHRNSHTPRSLAIGAAVEVL